MNDGANMNTTNGQELDEILAKTIYDTGAKLTEIGWERWGDNLEEAKQAILNWHNKQVKEVLDRLEQNEMTMFNRNDTLIHAVPIIAIQAERALIEKRMM